MIVTGIEEDKEIQEIKCKLLGSFLFFTQIFFKLRTGREFVLSRPNNRESHQITIARYLTDVFNLKLGRAWISMPPGHGKSTFLTYFIPWCFAHYPDCRFIYISYGSELASNHTANIKGIMELPLYKKLFGVKISRDSSAKDNFKTEQGGAVKAFGSSGSITGQDAGLPNLDRFSGAVLMDDMHKPDEVFSDTMRRSVIDNFNYTIKTRPRAENVPIIGIGHALHEDDLRNFLITGQDGWKWENIKLKGIDDAGNVIAPNIMSKDRMLAEKEFNPYVFWSQYQQEPQPAGGGIFNPNHFVQIDEHPDMLCTFITVDTAESTANHADHTVFSFWGLYEITYRERKTGDYGLHWINCVQVKIEPADLEDEFMMFYARCLEFKTPPRITAIEKKSSGTTLIGVLNKIRGLEIHDIERTKLSKNKVARYFEAQPYVSKRLVSIPTYGKHTPMCLEHMRKITANNTHYHDDIADTFYDAVKISLVDKMLLNQITSPQTYSATAATIMQKYNKVAKMRTQAWQR